MNELYNACHGVIHKYVVWHDVWGNKGFERRPLGTVETRDEMRTRLKILSLLGDKKMPLIKGGRNYVSMTLAEAESVPVVMGAEKIRKFRA